MDSNVSQHLPEAWGVRRGQQRSAKDQPAKARNFHVWKWIAGAVCLTLALLVWPTPYRELTPTPKLAERGVVSVRVHRVTGHVQYLMRSGWWGPR